MKKFLKLLMAFSLCFATGCSSNTSGTQETTETTSQTNGKENLGSFLVKEKDGVIDFPQFGIKITIPEELQSDDYSWAINGTILAEMGQASIITLDKDDNDMKEIYLTILAKRKPINLDDYVDEELGLTKEMIYDLGSNGTFYYVALDVNDIYQVNPDYVNERIIDNLDEDEKEAYIERLGKAHELLDNIELTDLVLPDVVSAADIQSSKLMDMKVQTFDGEEVRLGDLISQNKVTLINFWGTFCGSCIQEMPWLEEVAQNYKDDGFGIVGICMDVADEEGNIQDDLLEDGKEIVKQTGVTYPCVIGIPEINEIYSFNAFPTTFIVDSEGNMIQDPILGSKSEQAWSAVIEESLNK